MRREPLLSSVLWLLSIGLLVTFGLSISSASATMGPTGLSYVFLNSLEALSQLAVVFVASVVGVATVIVIFEQKAKYNLLGEVTETLTSTLGKIPRPYVPNLGLVRMESPIDKDAFPDVLMLFQAVQWRCGSTSKLPSVDMRPEAVAELCKAWGIGIEDIDTYGPAIYTTFLLLQTAAKTPASSRLGAHDGITLPVHCYSVCQRAAELMRAGDFRYIGLYNRRTKSVELAPASEAWDGLSPFERYTSRASSTTGITPRHKKSNKLLARIGRTLRIKIVQKINGTDDPEIHPLLFLLTALAHDIGKKETFVTKEVTSKDGTYNVVSSVVGDHGPVGAKMLAKFPAFNSMPYKERASLYMALSYYHEPEFLPCDMNAKHQRVISSDHAVCLTMALIEADIAACKAENHDPEDYGQSIIPFDPVSYRPVSEAVLAAIKPGNGVVPYNNVSKQEYIGITSDHVACVDFNALTKVVKNHLCINSEVAKFGNTHLDRLEALILDVLFLEKLLITDNGSAKLPHHYAIFSVVCHPRQEEDGAGDEKKKNAPSRELRRIVMKRCILVDTAHPFFGKHKPRPGRYEPEIGSPVLGQQNAKDIRGLSEQELADIEQEARDRREQQLRKDRSYQQYIANRTKMRVRVEPLEDLALEDDVSDANAPSPSPSAAAVGLGTATGTAAAAAAGTEGQGANDATPRQGKSKTRKQSVRDEKLRIPKDEENLPVNPPMPGVSPGPKGASKKAEGKQPPKAIVEKDAGARKSQSELPLEAAPVSTASTPNEDKSDVQNAPVESAAENELGALFDGIDGFDSLPEPGLEQVLAVEAAPPEMDDEDQAADAEEAQGAVTETPGPGQVLQPPAIPEDSGMGALFEGVDGFDSEPEPMLADGAADEVAAHTASRPVLPMMAEEEGPADIKWDEAFVAQDELPVLADLGDNHDAVERVEDNFEATTEVQPAEDDVEEEEQQDLIDVDITETQSGSIGFKSSYAQQAADEAAEEEAIANSVRRESEQKAVENFDFDAYEMSGGELKPRYNPRTDGSRTNRRRRNKAFRDVSTGLPPVLNNDPAIGLSSGAISFDNTVSPQTVIARHRQVIYEHVATLTTETYAQDDKVGNSYLVVAVEKITLALLRDKLKDKKFIGGLMKNSPNQSSSAFMFTSPDGTTMFAIKK